MVYQAQLVGVFGPLLVTSTGESIQDQREVAMELRLRVEPSRAFRDGSYGRLIHVESANLSQKTDGALSPLEGHLVGRTVELRTFPDGEILDISWADKVAGPSRYLDVFEVIYPALSPAAPSISEGEAVKQRIIWPFRQENELRWDNIVDAVWRNHGQDNIRQVETWRLSYEGAWGTEGKTRRASPAREWKASGKAKGTAHFDRRSSDLVSHSIDWSRVVTVAGVAGKLTQSQQFSGSVERLP